VARIVLGSYMVRYPLGGNLSWVLQWLVGLQRLGHEIYFVEKSGYSNSCFDPVRGLMSDDCSYGVSVVGDLLARFGFADRWCYVDADRQYYGLGPADIKDVFRSTDLFIDMGTHGSWLLEAAPATLRVLVEAEPGFTQMKMARRLAAGEVLPEYDAYYSIGQNIGTGASTGPLAGRRWRPVLNPVVPELFATTPAPAGGPFTTVMNWRAHETITFQGRVFGQKDVEFERFAELPTRTEVPLEIAVAGHGVPTDALRAKGWRVRSGHAVTITVEAYYAYILASRGEFSVAKNVFVATQSGWFSDRSAAYLASGRPVVVQDTGLAAHLPCGEGLLAVENVDEAAAALDAVTADYRHHAQAARAIAEEYLAAPKILGGFLSDLGVG
jgi:hypothetical protein